MTKKYLFLILTFVWLNLFDILTTWVMLELGGKEINSLFSYINDYGIGVSTIVSKVIAILAFVTIIFITLKYAQNHKSKFGVVMVYSVLLLVIVFYTFVIINNIRMLGFQIQEFRRVYG